MDLGFVDPVASSKEDVPMADQLDFVEPAFSVESPVIPQQEEAVDIKSKME